MKDFDAWLHEVKANQPNLLIPIHIEKSITMPFSSGAAPPCLEIDFYHSKSVALYSPTKPISKIILPI